MVEPAGHGSAGVAPGPGRPCTEARRTCGVATASPSEVQPQGRCRRAAGAATSGRWPVRRQVRQTPRMVEQLAPVLRVADARSAVDWYEQLGFVKEWEHRFDPGLPLYVGIARGQLRMHLSEHTGDARPGTLVYLTVEDVDAAAAAVGVTVIEEMPWGRDFEVVDLDGNRLRIGSST